MAGASVESCQFVVPEVSLRLSGSVLYTCNRLRRMRGGFHRCIRKHRSFALSSLAMILQSFRSELSGSSKNRRMRRRRLPDPGPIPEGVREPIYPRKKCAIWARWRPFPSKTSITRGPPGTVIAVSLDPILPHR